MLVRLAAVTLLIAGFGAGLGAAVAPGAGVAGHRSAAPGCVAGALLCAPNGTLPG